MKVRLFAQLSVMILTASLPFGSVTAAPAPGPACYSAVQGTGTGKLQQPLAEVRARANWHDNAKNSYGTSYAFWGKAKGRDMSCRHDGRKPAFRQWTCVATAQPCK